jgi:hypothetical protein
MAMLMVQWGQIAEDASGKPEEDAERLAGGREPSSSGAAGPIPTSEAAAADGAGAEAGGPKLDEFYYLKVSPCSC